MTTTAPAPDPFERIKAHRRAMAEKSQHLRANLARTDANGRPIPPTPDDAWTAQVRAAGPQAQVAIAAGARARAEKAEARVAELEAEQAAAVAEPDPRQVLADKNAALWNLIRSTDADGRPIPDNTDNDNEKD